MRAGEPTPIAQSRMLTPARKAEIGARRIAGHAPVQTDIGRDGGAADFQRGDFSADAGASGGVPGTAKTVVRIRALEAHPARGLEEQAAG